MSQKLIRMAQLASTPKSKGKLPVSPATVWRLVREGKFPKPFKLSDSITVFDEDEIDAHIAHCAGGIA